MQRTGTSQTQQIVRYRRLSPRKGLRKYWMLYAMMILPLAQYIIFRYCPLYGVQVAFKDYNLFKGINGSKWAGFKYFQEAFATQQFWDALKNTVWLNLLDLIFGFPMPIILAIMLYEMRSVKIKRVYQTLMYLPHFLSWIIIGGIVTKMFGTRGIVNNAIRSMGGSTVDFLTNSRNWVVMYVVTGVWQGAGWGTIIYLAAISGVNTELYEAAEVDGCGRFKRIWHITLPGIMPTIVTMLILQLGRMVGIGFERPYVMMNNNVRDVSEVISTFVYTRGILNQRYPLSTAVDLFGSVINMIFLIAANRITRAMGGEGGLW